MVDEFLSDEEQADAVKRWFGENWMWITAGIVIGLGGLFGWQYYQRYQANRAEAAANTLQQLAEVRAQGKDKASETFNKLVNDYASTPYADQARLLMAQAAVADNQLEDAAAQLREVMDKSSDKELSQVARLRLARVLIELQKPDEALALLDVTKAGAFTAEAYEVRGDALFAKGDNNGAGAAYQLALDASQKDADVSLLQLKLQEAWGELRAATAAGSAQ